MKRAFVASAALLLVVLSSESAEAKDPPWLGVIIVDGGGGAAITEVITGSPADAAGLRPGDAILRVEGTQTYSATSLISTVAALSVGADAQVEYIRNGKKAAVTVTLSARLTEGEILARRLLDQNFPDFELAVLAGDGSGDSDDHKGDVVVFYFFTASCRNCAALDSALEELEAEDDVMIAAVSSGQNYGQSALKTKLAAAPRGCTVLHDVGSTLRINHLRTMAAPIVVVTDRKRLVRYVGLGKDIDVKDLRFAVSRALKDDP